MSCPGVIQQPGLLPLSGPAAWPRELGEFGSLQRLSRVPAVSDGVLHPGEQRCDFEV